MRLSPAPLLVLGVGNPSRGDDALGPLFIERAAEALKERVAAGELELLTDFQLQIEHALDLEGRRRVVFVDASLLEPWFPAYSAEHRFQETRGCLQPLPGRGRGPAPGPDCSVVPQRRDRGLSRGRLIRDRYRDPDRDREGLKTAPSLRAEPPFRYERVTPASRPGHSTHALGPDQVLEAYRKIHGEPPESWLLAIAGERFELGEPLSARAADNLSAALRFFVDGLR